MMGSCSINSLVQNKFHTIEAYARNLAAAHASISRYIELLTDLSPKNSCKVSSPLANKCGAIAFDFIGNESATRHRDTVIRRCL